MELRSLLPAFIYNRIHKETQKGIVVGIQWRYGKRIKPKFSDMVDYKFSNPFVRAGIDELAQASVGSGFFTTVNEKAPHAHDVKTLADDFMHEIRLDQMNLDIANDLWTCGNSFLERITPEHLEKYVHLPIGSFYKIRTDEYGNLLEVEQNIEGTRNKFKGEDVKRLLLISWDVTGTSALGHGLLESLLNRGVGYTYIDQKGNARTVYRPSYREIMEEIEDAMRRIVVRYVPRFQDFIHIQSISTTELSQACRRQASDFSLKQDSQRQALAQPSSYATKK